MRAGFLLSLFLFGCDTKDDADHGEDCTSSEFYVDSDGDG